MMILTAENVTHYLMARGMVSAADANTPEFCVRPLGRRNRNFVISWGEGEGLFVKQVPIVHEETVGTQQREAMFYQLVRLSESFQALPANVPRLIDYDARLHVLTISLLPNRQTLTRHSMLNGHCFDEWIGGAIGRLLARVHTIRPATLKTNEVSAFPKASPWVLTFATESHKVMPNMTPATQEVVKRLVSAPLLCQHLRYLHDSWNTDYLIHGDIKWENFLLPTETDSERVDLIDWELVDLGDPAWDVACVFSSYIQHWVALLNADSEPAELESLIAHAPVKLESMAPALCKFWSEYAEGRGLIGMDREMALERIILMTAARLVLTAIEISQQLSVSGSRITEICLKLATEISAAPAVARTALLGIWDSGTDPHRGGQVATPAFFAPTLSR